MFSSFRSNPRNREKKEGMTEYGQSDAQCLSPVMYTCTNLPLFCMHASANNWSKDAPMISGYLPNRFFKTYANSGPPCGDGLTITPNRSCHFVSANLILRWESATCCHKHGVLFAFLQEVRHFSLLQVFLKGERQLLHLCTISINVKDAFSPCKTML